MFSIQFVSDPLEHPYEDASIPAAPGSLVLGKTTEDFLANLSLWGKADYEFHWKCELKAFFEGDHKVALVVSYNDPRVSSNMESWTVYRDGDWARFQNKLSWYAEFPHPFEMSKVSQYMNERQTKTTEGHQISEWGVHMRDIEMFLQRINTI